jgi:sarcosine oxidase subunit beta
MPSASAIIIGGGVIGLSAAYHLALRGFGQITVLEQGRIGDGSSRRAAGIITGLLWSETGVRARRRSLARFRELSDELPGYQFQTVGCLNLFDPAGWEERTRLFPLYEREGVAYEVLSAAEIAARWPELRPDEEVIGLFDPLGGYSEPDAYIPALMARLRDLGVTLREGCAATHLVEQGGAVAGVATAAGTLGADGVLGADVVIITTHAWLPLLLKPLGWRVPVKTFVHQRYVTAPLDAPVQIPAINANPQGGYIRPAAGNRLLAGAETADRAEFRVTSPVFRMDELTVPENVPDSLRAAMTPLWPRLAGVPWDEARVGLIAFSLDGEPILGPLPGLAGAYVGCAFHSGGFAYNPVAGELLAEFVTAGRPRLDVSAFAPERFAAPEVEPYLATTVPQSQAVRRRH